MTKDEALRLALDALGSGIKTQFGRLDWIEYDIELVEQAITAIKAALEANEFNPDWDTQAVLVEEIQRMAKRIEELEAQDEPWTPYDMAYRPDGLPQRTWVGLTDEDEIDWEEGGNLKDLVKAIEAALKERNS